MGKGMEMGIVTRKWEGMGMGKCDKIPVPHNIVTKEKPPSLKKTRIENFEELHVILMKTPIQSVMNRVSM